MDMRLSVTYTPCATSPRDQTGNIITFTQFEEGNLLSETRNDTEKGEKSDGNSIISPLLSEEEMDAMDYGDESYDEPMYTDMLEDISDGIHYHPNVNRKEAHCKMIDHIIQIQPEWKGALKATQNMGKVLNKVFTNVVKEI